MTVEPLTIDAPRWRLATRIAFRFVFCFFLLCYLPFPLSFLPHVNPAWQKLMELLVLPAETFFGVDADPTFNGSGDKLFYWLQALMFVVISAVATLLWSILDRRRPAYPRLHAWFHVYLRFALAAVMITYGSFKVVPSQFVRAPLDRLLQPFGDASPMGLLWTFMGASAAYTIFTGIGEIVGGLLLTNRRTSLLGALITAGVMTHVAALNFFYDVPVKIFSMQLLLTALVIAAPDAGRLARFFIHDSRPKPIIQHPRWRVAAAVAIALAVAGYSARGIRQSWQQRQIRLGRYAPSPLSGIWNVDELTVDGVNRPPLTTDGKRWRRFIVSGKEMASILTMEDERTRFQLNYDETRTMTLRKRLDPKFEAKFAVTRPDANTAVLDGTFEGKRVTATLRRMPDREFLLETRGFHWVNESPFNR